MAVTIKNASEIEGMRISCHKLGLVLNQLTKEIKPGMSTLDVDILGEKLIREQGGIPNFLHYNGFPGSICVSVNDVVVHGIPKKSTIIKDGDIVSVDCGLIYNGFHSDAARTVCVGDVRPEVRKLVEETKNSFFAGIKYAKAGNHLYDISNGVADYIDQFGYGIVRELVGHGIGRNLHEDPAIPNYHMNKKGMKLVSGMTVCVEPMINMGRAEVTFDDDGWTCRSEDRLPAAHYENTILITDGEPEILTLVEE